MIAFVEEAAEAVVSADAQPVGCREIGDRFGQRLQGSGPRAPGRAGWRSGRGAERRTVSGRTSSRRLRDIWRGIRCSRAASTARSAQVKRTFSACSWRRGP